MALPDNCLGLFNGFVDRRKDVGDLPLFGQRRAKGGHSREVMIVEPIPILRETLRVITKCSNHRLITEVCRPELRGLSGPRSADRVRWADIAFLTNTTTRSLPHSHGDVG